MVLSATEFVLASLSDGEAHACTELATGADVTPNAVEQAVSRLRRRGIPIVLERGGYRLVDRRRCGHCGRPLSIYNTGAECNCCGR